MSLKDQLEAVKKRTIENVPAQKLEIMFAATQQLQDQHLSQSALKKGDQLPSFKLSDATGLQLTSTDLLSQGGIVLSFYRGGWCPYCNLELKALQEILPEIEAKGYQLVAITPEIPDHSLTTSQKNELKFAVLSDIGNHFAKEMGLVFQMPEDLRALYHSFNLDVSKHNGNTDYELPMPATYIINSEGKITFSFIPEDYTERLEPSAILDHLDGRS